MSLALVLASAAVAASVPLLWWSVAGARPATRTVSRDALGGGGAPVDLRTSFLQRSAMERTIKPMMGAVGRFARRLTPMGWIDALEERIVHAGRPAAWTIDRVLIAKIVLGLAGAGVGYLAFSNNASVGWLLAWIGATAIGYFAPDLLLYSRGHERVEKITKQLPDTLDQLSISVEAGLGFEAAVARAGRTGTGPLAEELVRTMQEIQIGVPRTKALRNLADRSECPELRHFVLAIIQAESYGIPIADVLHTQAEEQRVKRRQRAEEKAMKMPVKLVFPLVICILPTLFIVILGPAVIQIVRTFGSM